MALAGASSLNSAILALSPTLSSMSGATQFINEVANYINQVQAGPTGTPGIMTYANAPAIAAFSAMGPVNDMSWISGFANAIHAGTLAATFTPGTVTDPAWAASGGVDNVPPSITNLSAALSLLISSLQTVTAMNNPAMPMAQAIHDYVDSFIFACSGSAPSEGGPVPVPKTFGAQ